jgi:hypothetical protein
MGSTVTSDSPNKGRSAFTYLLFGFHRPNKPNPWRLNHSHNVIDERGRLADGWIIQLTGGSSSRRAGRPTYARLCPRDGQAVKASGRPFRPFRRPAGCPVDRRTVKATSGSSSRRAGRQGIGRAGRPPLSSMYVHHLVISFDSSSVHYF